MNIGPSVTRCRDTLREYFGDFEIIVVDDASTDDTPARADELAELATPLHAPGESARLRIERIGAWLLGRAVGAPR